MSAEITVDSTWLLGTVAGVVGVSFLTWAGTLVSAWIEVRKARAEAKSDREALLVKQQELHARVAALELKAKELDAGVAETEPAKLKRMAEGLGPSITSPLRQN